MTVLGKRIQKERAGCGLSREELAQQLNVTPEELTAWEEGTGYPKFHIYRRIVKILKFPREIIAEDTMYQKIVYYTEPILSSPKQKGTQILLFGILVILQLLSALVFFVGGYAIGIIVHGIAVLFYIIGIISTVKNKMSPSSTGWFTGIPFLLTVLLHDLILEPKYGFVSIFLIPVIIILSIGMIVVFYLKESTFWYYVIQIICYIVIVEGILLLILASYYLAIEFAFFVPHAIILLALFRLQTKVYYKKRKWLNGAPK